MVADVLQNEDRKIAEQVLGYLNFSSGAFDARFLSNLNHVFQVVSPETSGQPLWQKAWDLLERTLQQLTAESTTFKDATQAATVLELVGKQVVPGYLKFHRDLLFHQQEATLCNAFCLARACEVVLQQGPSWDDPDRVRDVCIERLNDYIGHRPVAVLESRKIEPYRHEWVRPIPLYVRGAGVAVGPYEDVIRATLELLQATDEDILREACFDPERLDELALDPRAYDFDHPVNKRPNYHFGQWDPNHIDNSGYYRRFVIQQVTLDSLTKRLDDERNIPRGQLLFEAASVLAGTIIMSTGVSGVGPDTHDSSVTLANLLPRIAAYRDEFYTRLLAGMGGRHGSRLRQEAAKGKQPFGGARQHLNAELARQRAAQLEHVHLAAIYARMGSPQAALQQANIVPAASARTLCQIDCRLTTAEQALDGEDLERAARLLDESIEWLKRGIECGAIVDPWNILGFDANFSLFPAMENSVRDHRIDDLIALVEQIMALCARVWSEAAARDANGLCQHIGDTFRELVTWWRKYAAHEVSGVDAIDPEDAFLAAERVADALNLWHRGGAAVEDVRFWAPHADMFDSPKAYALVVRALLERGDFVASMALLMHWLSQASRIGLEQGSTAFPEIAERWMLELCRCGGQAEAPSEEPDRWRLACKFLDFMEANAEEYWQPPRFELGSAPRAVPDEPGLEPDSMIDEDEGTDEDEALYGAAYEDVVFRDSTDDGIEGEVVDYGRPSDDELLAEMRRLGERLTFLSSVARLWQLAVTLGLSTDQSGEAFRESLRNWMMQAELHRNRLRDLLDSVRSFRLPAAMGDHESMVEYDRVRLIRESMLEQMITTTVDVSDASRMLAAAAYDGQGTVPEPDPCGLGDGAPGMLAALAALLNSDLDRFREIWNGVAPSLLQQPLLYLPLAKGGDPHRIVTARARQRLMQDLLSWLPRLGAIKESCELIEAAREMERLHPVGPGAVTEFDELFKIGYKALVRLVVHSSDEWPAPVPVTATRDSSYAAELTLVDYLKQLTESLLPSWLAHSKTLRLSILEKVRDRQSWQRLVQFIERYGADIFTQRFLNLANLRAILHQGVESWLRHLQEDGEDDLAVRLLEDLDRGTIEYTHASQQLTLILETIVENYGEYRDYNSMTTQSDQGDLLYMLLDFLRLRTQYDRVCWHLKPVVWAHEILVRNTKYTASYRWRSELTEQTRGEAENYLARLAKLQVKYAMRMPTVADRLAECFIRPMEIDRIRALVKPAMKELGENGYSPNFEILKDEIAELTRKPTGVGLDVPAWLMALEEEVARVTQQEPERDYYEELKAIIPQHTLLLEETQQQLAEWAARE